MTISMQQVDGTRDGSTDWTEFGQRVYDVLTGGQAAMNYTFEEMAVEVPRDTGSNAPRATWKLNGTLKVTSDSIPAAAPRSSDTGTA